MYYTRFRLHLWQVQQSAIFGKSRQIQVLQIFDCIWQISAKLQCKWTNYN